MKKSRFTQRMKKSRLAPTGSDWLQLDAHMTKLLSLPPGLTGSFHKISHLPHEEYFVGSDPIGKKLGSGGGTIHLLEKAMEADGCTDSEAGFQEWLSRECRIMIHAGGQSRRLPAYAPVGKILTPIPVFRWARGQRIDQTLLSLQLPLYERICEQAGASQHTLVCSGDVLITTDGSIPHYDTTADVVCFAIGVDADIAKNHGVFLCRRDNPQQLDFMLQKPQPQQLGELSSSHYFLIDTGAWLLSDKAVVKLREQYQQHGTYDLYSEFGQALGNSPSKPNGCLSDLRVCVVPLENGEFYHFGTTHDLIASMVRLQNKVTDGRNILHHGTKAHNSIFTQNCKAAITFTPDNEYTWIENCRLGKHFSITNHNVVTGVPDESLRAALQPGQCLDIVPVGEEAYAVRAYMFDDRMDGERQFAPLYGIAETAADIQSVVDWALLGQGCQPHRIISADGISNTANLCRLYEQRRQLILQTLTDLQANHERSVFYQLDLHHAASLLHDRSDIDFKPVSTDAPFGKQISHAMMMSELGLGSPDAAFEIMRHALTDDTLAKQSAAMQTAVAGDQIVWARCPVRIDLAGGWTDTPPYCLFHGGDVLNVAVELNGQPPLQVYLRPCEQHHIILRSIDLGVSETITKTEDLLTYAKVGNAFSIPKAALVIAGFAKNPKLSDTLDAIGSGLELTLLSAIPSGSGLGTSSILASTVLAAINDFAALNWDKNEICHRTLILEQMLTTGGGWQDQYGGVMAGVKRLTTTAGLGQTPDIRWLADTLFTSPEYKPLHLLYYTGIRRTAKQILDEIVRGMFLQRSEHISTLSYMRENVAAMYDAIQRENMESYGQYLRRTWQLNQRLDSGTNPPQVAALTSQIDDLCLGYKLPGAGGGGYLYMLAKDLTAAARIRKTLEDNRQNRMARFVDITVSTSGLQVTRS